MENDVAKNDGTDAALAFLGELCDRLELKVELVPAGVRDEAVVIEVNGDGIDRLKRRPDLVSALTRLTAQAAGRAVDDRVRLMLDVGGEFEERKALLEAAADDIARAVQTSGRRAVVEGLSSTERRVMHSRLAEHEAVATRSEGDERARRLLIERA